MIQPGKVAWPFHSHLANEGLVFVLSGRGELRFSNISRPESAVDYWDGK